MGSQARARRVGDRIQEELAEILIRDVADPRLNLITITEVDVDRELAFASIYVTASDPESRAEEVLEGLKSAQGFLRSQLASRIQIKSFPQLRFKWDYSHERGMRIEELLDSIKSTKEAPEEEHGE
jgi:ribosome-binding factor A